MSLDLRSLATFGGLWRNYYPVFLALSISSIGSFAQQVVISNYNTNLLNEVAATYRIVSVFHLIVTLITVMTAPLVGQFRGAQKYQFVGSIVWQMIWFSIFCLPFFLILGKFSSKYLFFEIPLFSSVFFQMSLGFLFTIGMTSALEGFFLATQNTRILILSSFIATSLYVAFTYLFLFEFFQMGAGGVALSAVLSQCVQFLFLFSVFLNSKNKK